MPVVSKLLISALLLAALAGLVWFYGHSQKEIGDIKAKLERATADRIALETRTDNVTKELDKSRRELKTLKEDRNASKDLLNRVADSTGCLDVILPANFTDELRRAYRGHDGPP